MTVSRWLSDTKIIRSPCGFIRSLQQHVVSPKCHVAAAHARTPTQTSPCRRHATRSHTSATSHTAAEDCSDLPPRPTPQLLAPHCDGAEAEGNSYGDDNDMQRQGGPRHAKPNQATHFKAGGAAGTQGGRRFTLHVFRTGMSCQVHVEYFFFLIIKTATCV